MKERYVLGADIGSSNIKAVVFSLDGNIKGSYSTEVEETYPGEGYVEQCPAQIWERFCETVKNAVLNSNVAPDAIIGIGMDSNRCGLLLLDENFSTLTRFITWRDTRSIKQVKRFKEENQDIDLYRITGEEGLPQHTVFKVLWYRQEYNNIWDKARHIMFSPKDFVLYRMLGRSVTSKSIAQSTGLFDINTLEYSETILKRAGIPKEMLPELHDSNDIIGNISPEVSAVLGIAAGTPVICGLCDATASQLGSGSVKEGVMMVSIGTCGAVRGFSAEPHYEEDQSTQVRVVSPYGYVPSCTLSDAGSILKWFKNQFSKYEIHQASISGDDVYDIMNKAASKIPAGSEGLLLLPNFTGASYAFKDENLFGALAGIRNYHTYGHFARAIMEGVAFSLRIVIDRFRANGFKIKEIRAGGGGARSDVWVQILSDVLNMPISIPVCEESSCMGSAIMTVLGLGVYEDLETAVDKMVKADRAFYPDKKNKEQYDNGYFLFNKLNKLLSDSGYYAMHNELTRNGKAKGH